MLTTQQFHEKIQSGIRFLDGATGSNLMKAGMPQGCCAEEWILAHPEVLVDLQRKYARAGCQIIYTSTFQAQPIGLERVNLQRQTEAVNTHLAALTRSAAPGCLIAGDITTLAAFLESSDPDNFDIMVENYRTQIRGLMEGGVDLLVGETLMYSQEAEAILTAADAEGAGACMFSFTMQPDGTLYSGEDAAAVLHELEEGGAAAVGFNCVAADMMTPYLVKKLRTQVTGPLICKPNAGSPTINEQRQAVYPMGSSEFAKIMKQCADAGATLLGGCCGTTPEFMEEIIKSL